MAMSEAAKKAKREYMRQYRAKNRERINANIKEWKKRNPEKAKEYNKRYWERKARELENMEEMKEG